MAPILILFMLTITIPYLCITPCTSSSSSTTSSSSTSDGIGISLRLIHRDDPLSPLYDPKLTEFDRVHRAYHRTMACLHYHKYQSQSVSPKIPSPPVFPDTGEYLMRYSIGTPSTSVCAILDTASALTWLQCLPCTSCFNQTPPILDPSQSSTYKPIACMTQRCELLPEMHCNDDYTCKYNVTYVDHSSTSGVLATKTFLLHDETTFDKQVRFFNVIFGCGHENSGLFMNLQMGVLGFGRNVLSFPAQAKITRFSHCFVARDNYKAYSDLRIGDDAILSPTTTPIIETPRKIPYYVNLDSISVGDDKLDLPVNTFELRQNGSGGFFMDTGTSFTILNNDAYKALVTTLTTKSQLRVRNDPTRQFGVCFEAKFEYLNILPDITLHFAGGVNMKWTPSESYLLTRSGLWCLAVLGGGDLSILGNYQMQNFNIGYDLRQNVVSISRQSCIFV